jgi:hypothetical protein
MEGISLNYKRRVVPSKVLPPKLLKGYYDKNQDVLLEVESWLSKNGLTILFTLQEAYGDETVWLGSDHNIYIGTEKCPNKDWLKKCLLRDSPGLLRVVLKEGWTQEEMFEELKKRSEALFDWYKDIEE